MRPRSVIRYVDLFCGIGGFRLAIDEAARDLGVAARCVFSSDIDPHCRRAYEANFGESPVGDIREVRADDVPDHDLLLAGFPCQPFSIIGDRRGFADARGTLFFDIARIIEAKRPRAFCLENVKLLVGHNKGRTMRRILEILRGLGYSVEARVLNALDFGLPQKRERVFIVGARGPMLFSWPAGGVPMRPLSEILEPDGEVPDRFFVGDRIRKKRLRAHKPLATPSIWHENKAGHISSYPYSCALRAGASYNYLLVNGIRRPTPREMLRLQGFPEIFKIVVGDAQARTQAGNALPIPVAAAVMTQLLSAARLAEAGRRVDSVRDRVPAARRA